MVAYKKDPNWKPADNLDGKNFAIIKLLGAKPVWSGSKTFKDGTTSESNLWTIEVEDQKVFDRDANQTIEHYTGKATVFPSEGLHRQFLEQTNGTKEGVKLKIEVDSRKNKDNKFYTVFVATLVEGGVSPPSSLLYSQNQCIKIFQTLVEVKQLEPIEKDFLSLCKSQAYNIQDETVLKKMWGVYNERYPK